MSGFPSQLWSWFLDSPLTEQVRGSRGMGSTTCWCIHIFYACAQPYLVGVFISFTHAHNHIWAGQGPLYFLACYSLGIDIFSRPWNLVGCLMFSYDFYFSQFGWLYTSTWNAGFLCSVNERQLLMTWLCVCVIEVPITVLPFLPWIVQWFSEHLSRQERMG